jgi:hypothetical protein
MSIRGSEAGLDLERCATAGRQRPLRRHSATGYEERPYVGGLSGRHEDAARELSHAIEPLELATDPLQSRDPVA